MPKKKKPVKSTRAFATTSIIKPKPIHESSDEEITKETEIIVEAPQEILIIEQVPECEWDDEFRKDYKYAVREALKFNSLDDKKMKLNEMDASIPQLLMADCTMDHMLELFQKMGMQKRFQREKDTIAARNVLIVYFRLVNFGMDIEIIHSALEACPGCDFENVVQWICFNYPMDALPTLLTSNFGVVTDGKPQEEVDSPFKPGRAKELEGSPLNPGKTFQVEASPIKLKQAHCILNDAEIFSHASDDDQLEYHSADGDRHASVDADNSIFDTESVDSESIMQDQSAELPSIDMKQWILDNANVFLS